MFIYKTEITEKEKHHIPIKKYFKHISTTIELEKQMKASVFQWQPQHDLNIEHFFFFFFLRTLNIEQFSISLGQYDSQRLYNNKSITNKIEKRTLMIPRARIKNNNQSKDSKSYETYLILSSQKAPISSHLVSILQCSYL